MRMLACLRGFRTRERTLMMRVLSVGVGLASLAGCGRVLYIKVAKCARVDGRSRLWLCALGCLMFTRK